ncbi:MAG: homoserine kinase [Candidatus Promineifilaceae bacterium]|nr:homoserine kinase [Candidatus Promineifilaceae bacterium]
MNVTVAVPATTANLGPGFDCLGLALGLYNRVTLREWDGLRVTVKGEGAGVLPLDRSNPMVQAVCHLFDSVGYRPAGLWLEQENGIPVAAGLGSSAAAFLGGLLAANALIGKPLQREEILAMATRLEGHPDNVASALYGGLVLVIHDEGRLVLDKIATPEMRVVVVLPDYALPTVQARAALPPQVPLADAVFNSGRLAMLIRALESGDYERLGAATEDRLHQPYRIPLIPGMADAFRAARAAGAAAATLSGAGPSIVAFAPENHESIAEAIARAFAREGLESRRWILPIDRTGSVVAKVEEQAI